MAPNLITRVTLRRVPQAQAHRHHRRVPLDAAVCTQCVTVVVVVAEWWWGGDTVVWQVTKGGKHQQQSDKWLDSAVRSDRSLVTHHLGCPHVNAAHPPTTASYCVPTPRARVPPRRASPRAASRRATRPASQHVRKDCRREGAERRKKKACEAGWLHTLGNAPETRWRPICACACRHALVVDLPPGARSVLVNWARAAPARACRGGP